MTAQVPSSTYRLQFHAGFTFRDAAALVPYLASLGVGACYASPYLKATPGTAARLRHFRPQRAQSGAWRRWGLSGVRRRASDASHRTAARLRAQSHGYRRAHECLVVRRARERAVGRACRVLRHRLGARRLGDTRQAAVADPGRSVRLRARARPPAARLRERRAPAPLLRSHAADQPAPGAVGLPAQS